MKKNIKLSGLSILFAAMMGFFCFCTSCSMDEFDLESLNESLNLKVEKDTIFIDAAAETNVLKLTSDEDRNIWIIKLSDGNTVTAFHSGTIKVEDVTASAAEFKTSDSTWTVMVEVETVSTLNTSINRRAEYVKMVKSTVTPPTPPAPTVIRQYLQADTAMVYSWPSANKFTADMNHVLRRITEWSDGTETTETIWNKTFQVGKTFPDICKGDLYTQCPAAHFKYSNGKNILQENTTTEGDFTITTRNGEFVFTGTYVCDSGVEQNWYGKVALQEKDITVSYEDYSATYHFSFSSAFDAQWEENRGEKDEEKFGHTYKYDATSCTSWNIAFNGMFVGKVQTEVIVRQY